MNKIMFNKDLWKIIISSILFIIALFINDGNLTFRILIFLSYVIISSELYLNAYERIRKREIFDENILMIIASLGAFYIGEFLEGLVVIILFQLGEYLSDLSVHNSKKTITDLIDLRSDVVYLKNRNKIEKVDIKDVKLNSIFIVKLGEKIPLDGVVLKGSSNIDTSSLTGESLPKTVKEGSTVLSGTINLDSILEIKSTSVFETTTASKIIEIIENSNDKKTKTEKFITKFSKIYTPVVIFIALLIVVIPSILKMDFNTWLYRALEFLVVSCPCAIVISVPLGFFCGIGRASKEGILIKGSNELENLSKINLIMFDKTGTITHGIFEVSKISNCKNITKKELLEIAAYSETFSNHPISKSIIKKYGKEIDKTKITDFKETSGKGITCKLKKDVLCVGNYEWLKMHNIDAKKENYETGTVVYIGRNNEYLGYILISDIIKKESYSIKDKLKKVGINKIMILSGDDNKIVKKVADDVKIDEYYSNLIPVDKVKKVEELKKSYFTAFVGDGINDAPVMKVADIGISMGGIGSDAAIEASDVVLMKDNLNNIIKAIKISKFTKRIVSFNIIFALAVKIIIMILSFFGVTSIWLAVFSDVGITLLSILNTLRIMHTKKLSIVDNT